MATRPPLPYLLSPLDKLRVHGMPKLPGVVSGPIKGAIWAGLAMLGGATMLISAFNLTRRPDQQTVSGISNTVLIAATAAVVLVIYLRPKSRR
jgi:Ca2+/H+ antiporter